MTRIATEVIRVVFFIFLPVFFRGTPPLYAGERLPCMQVNVSPPYR